MQIIAEKAFAEVGEMIGAFMGGRPTNDLHASAQKATAKMEMHIGFSDVMPDDIFGAAPLWVDPAIVGAQVADSAETYALLRAADRDDLSDDERRTAMARLAMERRYNRETGRFDFVWSRAGAMDAAPNLINAQLASPGSIGYFTDIFRRPLIWSPTTDLVEMYTGDNPWAEIMTLVAEDYSGFAALMNAGSPGNNESADVEVFNTLMSSPVMNSWVSYRIGIEEAQRSQNPNSRFPFNGQPIAFKQRYSNYALDLLRDYAIIFGIPAAGLVGLKQVNGVTSWPGSSLTTIANGASTTKGHDMYIALAQQIATFLTNSQNMLRRVRIHMSPLALNLLSTYPYSDVYNPETAIRILVENFLAGEGKSGTTPDIEIKANPLCSAGTVFNSLSTDILIFSAPEIVGGPDEDNQSLVRFGMPLPKFMYPVFPGQYGTPYKTLMRYAGIFAPYSPAVAFYSGFGV